MKMKRNLETGQKTLMVPEHIGTKYAGNTVGTLDILSASASMKRLSPSVRKYITKMEKYARFMKSIHLTRDTRN